MTTTPYSEPREGASALLSVSAAARLLGVSPSSLRAWAAAGRVPHHRTRGGHRRFELDALVQWLADRGGGPPAPRTGPQELIPTRIEPMPEVADALADSGEAALDLFEEELTRTRPGAYQRASAGRRSRLMATLEVLSGCLADGDLAECYREAEWEGFRHGASGQPGDAPVTEALALRRAIDRLIADQTDVPSSTRRGAERALDRMVIRVASGYADGVQCRLRTQAEDH